jgi:hypothetical protein
MVRHARRVNSSTQHARRLVVIEVTCLALFLAAFAGMVVVIVIGWPWPLIAVTCVGVARASLEGIFRSDPSGVDEPSQPG